MTRLLVLLRHAKAEEPYNGQPDKQRPLTARGLADATAAGAWLASQDLVPELVLCSAARRTKQTWEQASAALPGAGEVRHLDELYGAGPLELLELVRAADPRIGTLLVVGHNPTMELMAALLDPERGGRMKTAQLSVHSQAGTWDGLAARSAPQVASHVARG
ncbi:SixA phosphatase family protein [Longispora albida]|uniref:SixA phosphatase family protein n=1 Tax=Longispora albida TaxID=203523 RepID=UPI00036B8E51|nr:histidine phosphatase family protein [Longispora albida]